MTTAELQALYDTLGNVRSVADRLGMSSSHISAFLKGHGVIVRKRGESLRVAPTANRNLADIVEGILLDYANGHSVLYCSGKHHKSPHTVLAILHEAGVVRGRKGGPRIVRQRQPRNSVHVRIHQCHESHLPAPKACVIFDLDASCTLCRERYTTAAGVQAQGEITYAAQAGRGR